VSVVASETSAVPVSEDAASVVPVSVVASETSAVPVSEDAASVVPVSVVASETSAVPVSEVGAAVAGMALADVPKVFAVVQPVANANTAKRINRLRMVLTELSI
jgi:hypothetical protein